MKKLFKILLISTMLVPFITFANPIVVSGGIGVNSNGQVSGGVNIGTAGPGGVMYGGGGFAGNPGGISYINNGNTSNTGAQIFGLVTQFQNIANAVYGTLFVVALILFFIGIMRYIVAQQSGDAKDKSEAFKYLGFGVIALTVMVAIWGLVTFLASSFGLGVGGNGQGLVPSAPIPALTVYR